MKLLPLLHPVRNLFLLLCLLALGALVGHAQTPAPAAAPAPSAPAPIADRLDVYFGQTYQMPVDGAIDSFTTSPDGIIKVEKTRTSVTYKFACISIIKITKCLFIAIFEAGNEFGFI